MYLVKSYTNSLFFRLIFLLSMSGITGCVYTKKIKSGEAAYELKQYTIAIELLQKEFDEFTNNAHKARKAYLLGKSHEYILDYTSAYEWYEKAHELKFGPEAKKQMALLLKQQERYQEAVLLLEELKTLADYRVIAEREILICKEAFRWKSSPEPYQIENCIESSGYSHYSPVLFRNQYLLVASDRTESSGKSLYSWTGNKFSDLFLFTKSGNFIGPFDPLINSAHNEGTACFTRDFQTIYFTRCQRENPENDDCKLMKSVFSDGVWTEPETLPFTLEKVQYGHPALMENDSVLIFSSDLKNPGGTFDLYYAELLDNGEWSDPFPLPNTINSDGNEKFPTTDGDTLYFSSDFLPGMGGYDIFKTFLRPDRRWSVPVNLKYPINSGGDDFSLVFDRAFKSDGSRLARGYFSSSRSKKGIDEVFVFTKYKKEEIQKEPEIPQKQISWFIAGKTWTEKFEEDDPNKTRLPAEILPDTRVQLFGQNGILLDEVRSNNRGIFLFKAEPEKSYILKANKVQYLVTTLDISTSGVIPLPEESSVTVQADLYLSKIYLDKEINLENIYYEFDQWNLTREAFPTLEKLTDMMQSNPMIKIQLNSHTDCRGDDDYNMELSQKRAQSVVNFLLQKGITPDRLIPAGFGETKPYINCICDKCSEEEHQKNRRTSFTIISTTR